MKARRTVVQIIGGIPDRVRPQQSIGLRAPTRIGGFDVVGKVGCEAGVLDLSERVASNSEVKPTRRVHAPSMSTATANEKCGS